MICVLLSGKHISLVICITRDMCFQGWGTHIIRHMCFPRGETHSTRDRCFPGGEHMSLGICVSQGGGGGGHISLGIPDFKSLSNDTLISLLMNSSDYLINCQLV